MDDSVDDDVDVATVSDRLIQHSDDALPSTEVFSIADTISAGAFAEEGDRPKLLFQPAVPKKDDRGRAILRPTVRLADHPSLEVLPSSLSDDSMPFVAGAFDEGRIPLSQSYEVSETATAKRQIWSGHSAVRHRHRGGTFARLLRTRRVGYDVGIGRERLPFALFEMDSTQPLNNIRFRFDAAYNLEFPDRAEFYWAKIGGKGPPTPLGTETGVDYQDIRILMEVGGPRFSLGTELPIRFLDPTFVGNTAGFGDMSLTTKILLLDGDTWQITHMSRTQLPTGTPGVGRGNGHTSMTQGLLARYTWNPDTMIHSELKLWFPLGADPDFGGEVLRYGFGIAKVLYDRDDFAVIPTLEFVGWSILSGRYSAFGVTDGVRVDNENIFNIHPGVRFAKDTGGELGLFELGFAAGVAITERHWYRGMMRMDVRFSF